MSMDKRLRKLERHGPEPLNQLTDEQADQRIADAIAEVLKENETKSAEEIIAFESGMGDRCLSITIGLLLIGGRVDAPLVEQALTLAKNGNSNVAIDTFLECFNLTSEVSP